MATHAVQIGFHVDAQRRAPARLMHDWPTMVDVAEAAHRAGSRVTVVQASVRTETIDHNGVCYRFFAADVATRCAAHSDEFKAIIRALDANVFHVHGLHFSQDVAILAELAPSVPILLQDHASRPPPPWRPLRRRAWRRGFASAAAVSFCSSEQSRPFIEASLIGPGTEVLEIPEASSRFTPGRQSEARLATGLHGDPSLLWIGQLIDRKDPLTVLEGVSRAALVLPKLQLWVCYQTDTLLAQVRERIAGDPLLRGRVQLVGRVPHPQVEQLMRAADIFVLGSRFEGSGYALIEALACGLAPVVTAIPSFRALTGAGAVGRLWNCGDCNGLSESLLEVAARPRDEQRRAVRAHFDRTLSIDALGGVLADAYQHLQRRRGSPGRATDPARTARSAAASVVP